MINIGTAIVGCGGLGATHARCIAEIDGLQTSAYCDLDRARADAMADEFGGYGTTEFDRILADDAIKIIYVTTQHDSHADLCCRALAAGKHVMVEKPLAMSLEQCLQVRDAAAASPAMLMVAFKMRYYELLAKARELIPEPLMITMQLMDVRWGDQLWVNDPVRGGGNVLAQGCHATDLIRFLAGRDPIEVYAAGGNFYQRTGVVDNLSAVFRFDGDVAGNWIQGDCDTPQVTSKFFLQLFAEGRAVTLTDRLTTLVYTEGGEEKLRLRGTESGFHEESRDLLRALREEAPSPVDVTDGLYATVMALQAMASTRSHRPEPIRDVIAGR